MVAGTVLVHPEAVTVIAGEALPRAEPQESSRVLVDRRHRIVGKAVLDGEPIETRHPQVPGHQSGGQDREIQQERGEEKPLGDTAVHPAVRVARNLVIR